MDNYFYCSNRSFITPRFVESCRFYRWKEENGFNAWTNKWNLLKHVFHHTHGASEAMIGLIFIAIIITENYRYGNLRRGKQKNVKKSLKLHFRDLIQGIDMKNRRDFLRLLHFYLFPAPS